MLNFPLASVEFLRNLRYWPIDKSAEIVPTVHVYTFARGDTEAAKTPAGDRRFGNERGPEALFPVSGRSVFHKSVAGGRVCRILCRRVRRASFRESIVHGGRFCLR